MTRIFGKAAWAAAALALAGVAGGGAWAQGQLSGADAVKARQQHYKQLGGAFKAINDQLKTGAPDKAVIAANAEKMKALAADLPHWYPKGSGPEAGVKTAARPIVWTESADFAERASKLQAETAKLQQFAQAGDLDQVRAQVKATGGACKNCHDKFRVPDEH